MLRSLGLGTHIVGGVRVTSRRVEQSSSLEVTAGNLSSRVPVTARAQLFALHFGLLKLIIDNPTCTQARRMIEWRSFMLIVTKGNKFGEDDRCD